MRGDLVIQKFINGSGSVSWRVSGMINGQRRRQNFKAESAALVVKQNWERERANLQPLPGVTTRLNAAQCAEAESCFHRLAGHALTLSKAVDFALANCRPSESACLVADAIEGFLRHKRAQNCRPDTLRNLEGRLHLLVVRHGTVGVNEVLAGHLRSLIHRPGNSPRTVNNNRLALFTFFKWCVKQGYRTNNPVAGFDPVKQDDREPVILSLAECVRLLHAASTVESGALLPYVVLGLFCGIRPAELRRLSWNDVDLIAGTVMISGKAAKLRARRVVSISGNADDFLSSCSLVGAPLFPDAWRKIFLAVRECAGLKTWTPDALRHTAISYHLARGQNEGATAAWAGNSPAVVHRHYKGLVKAADVAAFWAITPASLADNITELKVA